MTLFGIVLGFLSLFWSFGYVRLSRKLRAFLDAPSLDQAPKIRRSDVIAMLEKVRCCGDRWLVTWQLAGGDRWALWSRLGGEAGDRPEPRAAALKWMWLRASRHLPSLLLLVSSTDFKLSSCQPLPPPTDTELARPPAHPAGCYHQRAGCGCYNAGPVRHHRRAAGQDPHLRHRQPIPGHQQQQLEPGACIRCVQCAGRCVWLVGLGGWSAAGIRCLFCSVG